MNEIGTGAVGSIGCNARVRTSIEPEGGTKGSDEEPVEGNMPEILALLRRLKRSEVQCGIMRSN